MIRHCFSVTILARESLGQLYTNCSDPFMLDTTKSFPKAQIEVLTAKTNYLLHAQIIFYGTTFVRQ